MKSPKATQTTDRKDGFLFVGNEVVLDFLNTRPLQNLRPIELLPDFKALLRWYCAADLLTSRQAANLQQRWADSGRARRIVHTMRDLRERLREEILAWEGDGSVHHSAVQELNRLMAEHPMRLRLRAGAKGLLTELYFAPQQPEDLLAPLAYAAARLFSKVDRTRVRKCDHCVLHFHDTSKKGTRRWCSMALCGNRIKVAAYAARQRRRRS